jgi:nicotinate dehydrogenase subunit A
MTAAEMLNKNPKISDSQIREGLSGLKCRCGTHLAIHRAVKRAAKAMAS